MDKWTYASKNWYLTSKKEIKKNLQEHQLTFEQAQVVLEDTIRDLNNESKSRLL